MIEQRCQDARADASDIVDQIDLFGCVDGIQVFIDHGIPIADCMLRSDIQINCSTTRAHVTWHHVTLDLVDRAVR